jgi:hypothetical protein
MECRTPQAQPAKATPFAGGPRAMSAESAVRRLSANTQAQPAKATPFAGGPQAMSAESAVRRLSAN